MRVARFLAVRPQAFEQAPERRLVSRRACCPIGIGLGPEPIGVPLALCAVRRVITEGHCLLPASSGPIVQRAGRGVEAAVSDLTRGGGNAPTGKTSAWPRRARRSDSSSDSNTAKCEACPARCGYHQ